MLRTTLKCAPFINQHSKAEKYILLAAQDLFVSYKSFCLTSIPFLPCLMLKTFVRNKFFFLLISQINKLVFFSGEGK